MSTKSYTLADGTTATVTATENGVPFNEGMQALTKAIKARVSVRDGGSGTGGASGFPGTGEAIGLTYTHNPYQNQIVYTTTSGYIRVILVYWYDRDSSLSVSVENIGANSGSYVYSPELGNDQDNPLLHLYLLCFTGSDAYYDSDLLVDVVTIF